MTKEPKVSAETRMLFNRNKSIAKKKGNTDAKQIASKQEYEVYYVSYSYGIPMNVVYNVINEHGTSRKRVYAILREMGYVIEYKNRRK